MVLEIATSLHVPSRILSMAKKAMLLIPMTRGGLLLTTAHKVLCQDLRNATVCNRGRIRILARILRKYGDQFYDYVTVHLNEGSPLFSKKAFTPSIISDPRPIVSCSIFAFTVNSAVASSSRCIVFDHYNDTITH